MEEREVAYALDLLAEYDIKVCKSCGDINCLGAEIEGGCPSDWQSALVQQAIKTVAKRKRASGKSYSVLKQEAIKKLSGGFNHDGF